VVKPAGQPLPRDTLYANAVAAAPGAIPIFASQPLKPDQPFHATVQADGGQGLFPNREVYVDPYTGAVLRVDSEAEAPALVKMVTSSEALHAGTWSGVLSRLLYTFAGLMPLGLYVTGFMRWRRRGNAKRPARRRNGGRAVASAR
jgi:uncharacterized iron-regulated membrane protein